MGQVSHLFLATGSRRPVREVERAMALANLGLEGCRRRRAGSRRQVLLVDGQAIDAFGLQPGQIKENVTVSGFRVDDLVKGQRVVIGEAVFEVTGPCEPCSRMDDIRPGLWQELYGQRGTLCLVVEGGLIQCGDTIQLAPASITASQIGGCFEFHR